MSRTYRQQFDEALACTTREEADAWLAREVESIAAHALEPDLVREAVAQRVRENLGYMSGYHGMAEAEHVYAMFDAEHPVFGTPAMRAKITPEDAYAAGVAWAEGWRPPGEKEQPGSP